MAVACIAVAVVGLLALRSADDERDARAAAGASVGQVPAAGASSARGSRESRALTLPEEGYGWIAVRIGERVGVHASPGGRLLETVGARTEYGSRRVFSVVSTRDGWAGVPTPLRANGELGWIKLDSRRLKGGSIYDVVVVDLSERRAEVRRGESVLRSFTVTIGMPGADTPTGRFAVTDILVGNLNSAYGCCALALTASQPHAPSGWLGGRRIAIHGTYGQLGVAASHGCVRASNDDMRALVDSVPLGTPVFVQQ